MTKVKDIGKLGSPCNFQDAFKIPLVLLSTQALWERGTKHGLVVQEIYWRKHCRMKKEAGGGSHEGWTPEKGEREGV